MLACLRVPSHKRHETWPRHCSVNTPLGLKKDWRGNSMHQTSGIFFFLQKHEGGLIIFFYTNSSNCLLVALIQFAPQDYFRRKKNMLGAPNAKLLHHVQFAEPAQDLLVLEAAYQILCHISCFVPNQELYQAQAHLWRQLKWLPQATDGGGAPIFVCPLPSTASPSIPWFRGGKHSPETRECVWKWVLHFLKEQWLAYH